MEDEEKSVKDFLITVYLMQNKLRCCWGCSYANSLSLVAKCFPNVRTLNHSAVRQLYLKEKQETYQTRRKVSF